MSKKFPKINVKFHSNVITHNQTITLQHILFIVIKITISIVIFIQCTKRTLSIRFKFKLITTNHL